MVTDRAQAPCPREGCDGVIPVPRSLPAGTYHCICKATRVRLSWITKANFQRDPMLTVAEPTDGE